MTQPRKSHIRGAVTRRQFLQAGRPETAAGLVTQRRWPGQNTPAGQPAAAPAPGSTSSSKPNIVFISADQLGIEAISAHGCPDVHTPNIDRLVMRGLSFQQCYTADPLCAPARSSWFTGRMPSETGVVDNGLSLRPGIPTMGHILQAGGYDTYYAGKWHLPMSYTDHIPGFRVLPSGLGGEGNMGDTAVSQACEGLLSNRRSAQPFLLVASLLQPHDICTWISNHDAYPTRPMPDGLTESQLPALPPNFADQRQPKEIKKSPTWTPTQWRYYLWSYYRHVEMVDAEIGRILDAVENSPTAGNTIVIFASDHGEGQARHKRVTKNFLYDEAARVPLVISWPGQIAQGARDHSHLISSTDFLPTMCDYAGVATPDRVVGKSLRPLLEGKNTVWRDMVAAEVMRTGRMVRTDQYKYIAYRGRRSGRTIVRYAQHDPWETKNLYSDAKFASTVQDHRKLLADCKGRLDVSR